MKEYLKDPFGEIKNAIPELSKPEGYNMSTYYPPFIAQMPIHRPDSLIRYHMKVKGLSKKKLDDKL